MLQCTAEEVLARIDELPRDMELSKALLAALQGVSPIVAREVQNSVGRGGEVFIRSMTPELRERTLYFVRRLIQTVRETSGAPYMVVDAQKKPKDFAFLDIHQYGASMVVSKKERFSELLDDFYAERDQIERMRVKSHDLLRLLTNHADRLNRKVANQTAELADCAKRDTYRIQGDLISANMYAIEKGTETVRLQNFYDENLAEIEIRLDPALTPQQNAQKYYKAYRKAKTAEEKLTEQIALAKTELAYIDSVFESLALAESERDLNEIRPTRREQGLRPSATRQEAQKAAPLSAPLKFTTGRLYGAGGAAKRRQNDKLNDEGCEQRHLVCEKHPRLAHGSGDGRPHADGGRDGRRLRCWPRATVARRDSAQVPRSITQIRYVSKPQGRSPAW